MKSKTKLILSLLVLVINFTIFMVSIYYFNLINVNNGGDGNGEYLNTIPIFIDGDGTNNWAWAVSQPWCGGSGTYNDPYIIENLDIDGTEAEACISIRDSSVYFLIKNCFLDNAQYAGISLSNVRQGWIENNTITQCSSSYNSAGIMLDHWESNMIIENSLNTNNIGIYFFYCGFHNITKNLIWGNVYLGLNISYSNDIIVHGNSIQISDIGIWQFHTNFSVIYGNLLRYFDYEGVVIINSYFSQIMKNTITYSTYSGITLSESSSQNRIFDNDFIENGIHARDDGSNN